MIELSESETDFLKNTVGLHIQRICLDVLVHNKHKVSKRYIHSESVERLIVSRQDESNKRMLPSCIVGYVGHLNHNED